MRIPASSFGALEIGRFLGLILYGYFLDNRRGLFDHPIIVQSPPFKGGGMIYEG
jgi:hypothetical protein